MYSGDGTADLDAGVIEMAERTLDMILGKPAAEAILVADCQPDCQPDC